ncbi:MarR family winged helix-turn-helix transcriptional regulator [Actinoplanes palleronii]|uniref:HTH marR-type domain-containing protein n=1 Tax=Actinoplanes palleronii TaxID=113570 RepID=A0ABQ4BRP8_9ACTN|nr:MarR family transcriptional regulator [Actinoplanes palleronii]GIE73363.1 hypothetical protein Apa02nite_094710 [Actinoplanes palleronii]
MPAADRWRELHRLHVRVEVAIEAALRAHRLTAGEYAILEVLAEHGHARMQLLAQAVELPQSTTSRLVAQLEQTGLLERYLCEADRRGVFTSITADGRVAQRAAQVSYEEALESTLPRP